MISSPSQINGLPIKRRGMEDRPATPLLPKPNSNDLAGCRTCLIGENVTNANAAMNVTNIDRM
jgi:hypothetical protein